MSEMSTDQGWIRTEANFTPDGTAIFFKIGEQDWIGLRKFLLF